MTPERIEDFLGDWRIQRGILDHLTGHKSSAEGHASLSLSGECALWAEKLTLRLPNQLPMQATRRYLWQTSPGGITIRFEDGRYFHHIALNSASARDHHECTPDSYSVVYDFQDWPAWTTEWHVRGPRKNYVMRSQMTRDLT